QAASSSTNCPKLGYQPQRRQTVTSCEPLGALHFSQHGPVHSDVVVSVAGTDSSVMTPFSESKESVAVSSNDSERMTVCLTGVQNVGQTFLSAWNGRQE